MSVICDLLDVPAADRDRLRAWSAEVANVIGNSRLTSEESRAAVDSMRQLLDYIRWLVAHQGAHTPDGLLRAFAAAESGARLTGDELLANVVLLLIAGHETTSHFIGNAMLALLQHPARLHELRRRPELLPAAVEELLRYDAPVQILLRRARQDLDEGGIAIRSMITRLPDLRLADAPLAWNPNLTFRGLTRLEVAFTPATRGGA